MLNFPAIEEKILKYWKAQDIFQKTLAKDAPKGSFTFYEGPPTANGMPGIHHVLARAFKDLIPRYKTMQGYHVERKAGWDTHGLPVELQVEKQLKISGKPEIEKFGVDAFNQACKKSVWQYKQEWEKLTERIAFWLDLEHPYITYDKDYVESLWWIFKQINEKGLLYQGHKVVPHCPRCGTALSSHEVAQGYKEVAEPSVYIKFKVKKGNDKVKEGDYILSWTTTPWTLPGNVALAVGEKMDYVKILRTVADPADTPVEAQNFAPLPMGQRRIGFYILAKSIFEQWPDKNKYKIESEFKGKDLVGIQYEPLFPGAIPEDVENYQNAFKVYPADFVTTEDGTGVVHTAVMYGEDDYNLGTAVGLPKHHTVDENGKFVIELPGLSGKFVKNKEVERTIIDYLKENNLFFQEVTYTHDYPFCWRCDTPLLYYAKDSWFFKMSELKAELIKENQKINWVPEHIKDGRFGEWLLNIKDWAISRERYWGTPLPIWKCADCGQIKVIGSYEELHRETQCPLILQADFDPHRPVIDEYKLKCDCGGQMSRVPEVADCWFDSGSMPLAQYHYPFANKEKVDQKDYYPADYIAEAIDQTRGWFYTLLALGVLLGKGTPYKNVICLGHINDAKGHKMSKSKGNVVDPWTVINQWGADALRLHLYTVNQPGESKNFDIKNVESVVKRNFMILFNVLSFYKIYASKIVFSSYPSVSNNILDSWILLRIDNLIESVTGYLDSYNIFSAGRLIMEYIDDLSTWYLRRSRERFKGEDENDKEEAIHTLGYCLLALSKLMAPFTPFIAEELYQQLGGPLESVHLETWPESGFRKGKGAMDMDKVRKIVELGLAKRDEAGIKVRQPLSGIKVIGGHSLADDYVKLIKDELNIKEVKFTEDEYDIKDVVYDLQITEELKAEGIYRELVRTINQLRKEAKLTIKDQIVINYQTDSELIQKIVVQYQADLLKNTISKKITDGRIKDCLIDKDVEVNGEKAWIGLK